MGTTGLLFLIITVINVGLLWFVDSLREKKADVKFVDSLITYLIEITVVSSLLSVIHNYSYLKSVIVVSVLNVIVSAAISAVLWKKKSLKFNIVPEFAMDYVGVGIIVLVSILAVVRIKIFNPDKITELCKAAFEVTTTDVFDAASTPAYRSIVMLPSKIGDIRLLRCFMLLLAICLGVQVADFCDKLSIKKLYKWIAVGITILNPIALYSSKVPTVHLYLAILVAFAVKEVVNAANNKKSVATVIIPIVGIMLVTLKSMFFIPLFMGVLLVMFAHDRRIERLVIVPVLVLLQILAVQILKIVCSDYVYSHWWKFVNRSNPSKPLSDRFIILYLLAMVAMSFILLLPAARKVTASVFADNGILKATGGISILVVMASMLKILYLIENSRVAGTKLSITAESFWALSIYTGIVVIPLAIIFMVFRDIKKPVGVNLATISMVFAYGLMFVCLLEKPIIASEKSFTDLTLMMLFLPYGVMMGSMMIENIVKKIIDKKTV